MAGVETAWQTHLRIRMPFSPSHAIHTSACYSQRCAAEVHACSTPEFEARQVVQPMKQWRVAHEGSMLGVCILVLSPHSSSCGL